MTIAAAHDALKAADEALAAAKVIRADAHEALVTAACNDGWKVVFSHRHSDGNHRVMLERYGRSLALEELVAETLREGATA